MTASIAPWTERELSTADAACAHCGLPVPAGQTEFCCDGCATVYAVLHASGLEAYYRHRDTDEARPAAPSGKTYAELDDPVLRDSCTRPLPGGLLAAELHLSGVHCAACVWLVERVPLVLPGVLSATLDVGRALVELVYDPTETKLSDIARTLDSFGYPAHPRHQTSDANLRRLEDRSALVRIAVAGAAAGNAMLMAFALYGGLFSGMDPEHAALLRWGSLAVTTPAVLWAGGGFFRGAWAALRTRTPHVDLPLAIGIGAGFSHGAIATLTGRGEIYFDSLTMLIFLLLVGRFVERRQTRAAHDAAAFLHSLAPRGARRVKGDGIEDVSVDALAIGDVVEIRAGEQIPVDGTVSSGSSTLDASLLTGESRPEEVGPGAAVHAGCVNLTSVLRVRVEATGAETRVGRLLENMERAARRRGPIVRLADRVAGRFVIGVLLAAAFTFGLWLLLDPARAIEHTVALLVVSCPCALGMATPLAVSAALGRAARRGILVKGGDSLEALARPALIVFDKTGTLTEGRLALENWHGDRSLQPLVAAAEKSSAHPIATALVRAIESDPELAASEVQQTLGGGIEARVAGRALAIGSPSFVRARVGALPEWAEVAVSMEAEAGRTPVVVVADGLVRALAALGDPLRADARASLDRLRAQGHRIAILSGDHPAAVAAVARELGVLQEVRGGVSPEAKLEFIERAAQRGPVVMVGDGVNDAAALSAATVGIAVHGGAEASLDAARAFTTRSGIAPVVELTAGARRTLRVIRRGIAFSLLYNAVGMGLAIAGVLSPLLAAILMPLSSLTVISNAYRSRTFQS